MIWLLYNVSIEAIIATLTITILLSSDYLY